MCHKTEEEDPEGTLPPTESEMGRSEANKERSRDVVDEGARKLKSYCRNLEKEKEEKVIRRLQNECDRRELQSVSFTMSWNHPVTLHGLPSVQDNVKGLVLRWLEDE